MNYFNLTGFKLLITTLFFSININAQVFQYRGILQNSFTLGTYHKDVVVGDVNNDGLLDLYMPQLQFSGNSTITDHIYLNNGIGFTGGINNLTNDFTFEPTNIAFPNATQIMTDRGYDGELVDLDSDGNLDIIRPDRTVVYVVWGNGDGTFGQVDILNAIGDPNFGKNYDDADFADLDNDGDIDFIIAQYGSGNNLIFRNDGTRNFTLIGNQLPAEGTHSISIGDYNNDGIPDIILANDGPNNKLYSGTIGSIDFVNPIILPEIGVGAGSDTPVADFTDLNQDGFLDIYIGHRQGEQGILFHSGNTNGVNNAYPTYTALPTRTYFIYDARYADINKDGNMEIITVSCCNEVASQVEMQVFSVLANTTIWSEMTPSFLNSNFHGNIGVELADLDNDGDLDLITGGSESSGGSSVHIYENTTEFDLYMQDVPSEFGVEPDIIAPFAWISDDIWVRNQQDGFINQVHQDAEFSNSQPVYVYVRVRNKSFASSLGTEQLQLYWAKAATALSWPANWNGSIDLSPPNMVSAGDFIGVTAIPSISAGGDVIVEIPWNTPNPANYNVINSQPWHFCLLARILATNDPMTFVETANLNANVLNNNNIAWKNLTIVDNLPGIVINPNDPLQNIVEVVAVGNVFEMPETFDIIFSIPKKELDNPITDEATIMISLDKELYDKWIMGGKQGIGIQERHTPNMSEQGVIHNNTSDNTNLTISNKKEFEIMGKIASFENITFGVNERNTVDIKILYPSNPVSTKDEFIYDIVQKKTSDGEVIGGVRYQIIKPDCESYTAGNDKFIRKGCTTDLVATPIDETVSYRWFDGNKLIGITPIISVSPVQTTTYSLKATTLNGCVSEDDVIVDVSTQQCNREKEIIKISPNPAKNIVEIEFKIKNTSMATLKLIKSDLSFQRDYVIDITQNKMVIDISSYPSGIYSVNLIADGIMEDSKMLIIIN